MNILHWSFTASSVEGLVDEFEEIDLKAKFRAVTGVLSSHPDSRDVHIDNMSITFHGAELLQDTRLELNVGRRYGLIGLNGCGEYVNHCQRGRATTCTRHTATITCTVERWYGLIGLNGCGGYVNHCQRGGATTGHLLRTECSVMGGECVLDRSNKLAVVSISHCVFEWAIAVIGKARGHAP